MAKKKPQTVSKRMQIRAEQRRKKRLTQIAVAAVVLMILAGTVWVLLTPDPTKIEVVEEPTSQEPLPVEISVDEAYEMYQAGDFLLDVRTQEEWDEFHIPGTTLITLDELENRVDEVPRDQNVVVVCRSGNRSQVGRDILRTAGFTQVTSMGGGVNDWRESGYPTE
jgi:rhodanese-related sulfurtransferase